MSWFWKHKHSDAVIGHADYNRLPDVHKEDFSELEGDDNLEPTHRYISHDESGYEIMPIVTAAVLTAINSGNDSPDIAETTTGADAF